jgi:hypothetical protein
VRAPDYLDARTGWRVWDLAVTMSQVRLVSLVFREEWPVRQEVVASCRLDERDPPPVRLVDADGHEAPHPRCSCGIHAARSLETVLPYLTAERDPQGRPPMRVLGLAALWGTVVEGSRGWCASRAYPARLYVPAGLGGGRGVDLACGLAEYGVPVELVDVPFGQFLETLAAPLDLMPDPA